jgi:hypothetical protein
MINKEMNENSPKVEPKFPEKKPNEHGGFYFSSSVKIFDPNSQEIIVQKRGDD